MSIVETKVSFANGREEVKRICKKNNKEDLANTIRNIRRIINDESITAGERCYKIENLVTKAYW